MVYKTVSYRICLGHKAELDPGENRQKPYFARMSECHNSNGGASEIGLTMGRARQLQRVRKLKP